MRVLKYHALFLPLVIGHVHLVICRPGPGPAPNRYVVQESQAETAEGTRTTNKPPKTIDITGKTAKGCPRTCKCSVSHEDHEIAIKDCYRDPTDELYSILSEYWYRNISITNASLSRFPCEVLSRLHPVRILDLSFNAITTHPVGNCTAPASLTSLNLSYNAFEAIPCYLSLDSEMNYVDLGHNAIQGSPCDLSEMSITKLLDLSHNDLDIIPCNITSMIATKVDMSHNTISRVSCSLSSMSVWYLDLAHNVLEEIPCNIVDSFFLETLDLSHNAIQRIPCSMSNLPKLKTLDLSYNALTTIPCNISTVPTLMTLDLSHNSIKAVSCSMAALTSLWLVDLRFNHIETVPCELFGIPKLMKLSLSNNAIVSIPCNISASIQWLYLDHNVLETIPCDMAMLEGVQQLYLSHNHIKSVPCKLMSKPGLQSLDLSRNALETLPCNLSSLTVWTLDLSHNVIKAVSCDLSTMRIYTLDLSHNSLETVPSKLVALHLDLHELYLSHNVIRDITCNMSMLYRLQTLGLSHNSLYNIPCVLSKMGSLATLNVSHNNIATIPCSMSTMFTLEELDLSSNLLEVLPVNLSGMQSLSALTLRNNSIQILPSGYLDTLCNLGNLDLTSNRIRVLQNATFYRVPYLQQLLLDDNEIDTIESDVFLEPSRFNSLAVVGLSHNRLLNLDSWPIQIARHNSPFHLNVQNNSLSQFTNHAGGNVTTCSHILQGTFDLQDNEFAHILDVFKCWNIAIDEELEHCNTYMFNVGGNPLNCDCLDYDLYQYIQDVPQFIKDPRCVEPASLRGKNPLSIPLDQFICNISNECPLGCSCVDVPNSMNISIICDAYNETELPTVLPALPENAYTYSLKLGRNKLTMLDFRKYLVNVSEAIFSYNLITNVSADALLSLLKTRKLFLNNNRLSRLPDDISTVTLGLDTVLRLGYNKWSCDCKALATKDWIVDNYRHIQDLDQIICSSPEGSAGRKLMDVDRTSFCYVDPGNEYITIAMLAGTAFLSLALLPLVYVLRINHIAQAHERKHWTPIDWDEAADEGREFDVFVSYATEDEDYVGEYLIPELEARGFKVCFHRVHFMGGKSIVDNICECIAKSKTMLAFYSLNFMESNFGMYEFNMAVELDAQNATNRLVTIKDIGLDIEHLKLAHSTYFKTHSYIIKEETRFWENLVYSLPKQKLGTVTDPGKDN